MGRKVVHVDIIQKDIDSGKKGHVSLCPIALALKRLKKKNVGVYRDPFWFSGMVGKIPWKALNFIEKFDRGKRVVPISFDLYEETH